MVLYEILYNLSRHINVEPLYQYYEFFLKITFYSFQNPINTPVKLMMDSPQITQIHCSQNVPRNSPMEVTIKNPVENHIHASQVKFD